MRSCAGLVTPSNGPTKTVPSDCAITVLRAESCVVSGEIHWATCDESDVPVISRYIIKSRQHSRSWIVTLHASPWIQTKSTDRALEVSDRILETLICSIFPSNYAFDTDRRCTVHESL